MINDQFYPLNFLYFQPVFNTAIGGYLVFDTTVVIWFEIGKKCLTISIDNFNYSEKKVEIEFNKTLGKCKFHWNSAKVVNFMFLPTFARKLINWLEGIILVRILFVLRLKGRTLHYTANIEAVEEKTEQKEELPIYVSMISYQFCHVNVNVLQTYIWSVS